MPTATAETAEPEIKIVHKGYCNGCALSTESLHKCPKCGRYVARPTGSARQLSTELRRGRKEIRDKHKPELERLSEALSVAVSAGSKIETKSIQDKIDAITKTMKKEIRAFLDPPHYVPGRESVKKAEVSA